MSILTGLKVWSLACKCVFYRAEHAKRRGIPWNWILKDLKCRNEIYQWIELKQKMKKIWSFVYLSCLLPKLWSLKSQKWLIFCIFCWCQQKISLSLHKIFLIGLWASISKISTLEGTEFHYFLVTEKFFDNSTLDTSQTVTPKPMNHTIFWKDSKGSFRCTL